MYTNVPNFSGLVYSIVLERRKNRQNFPHFQLQHFAVVPPSGIETKLNVGTQLQTFPHPTTSKPLLSSDAFWAKSFSQTLPFQSVMETL